MNSHKTNRMVPIILKILDRIPCNAFIHKILNYNVLASNYIMGIGAGGAVNNGGEYKLLKILKKQKNFEYIIFDVGANIGEFTKLCLSFLDNNDSFKIHCFEPSKTAFNILTNNLNNNPHVTLNNIGFGKEEGEFDLFYDVEGSPLSSLTKRKLEHFGIDFSKSEKVTLNTINNYCLLNNIQSIDLLKLDVEGHELDVLSGAEKLFKNNLIKMVSFEFGGCNIDTRTFFQDFYYFFKKRNMKIYRLTSSGYLHPIHYYQEQYEQFRPTNFLAIHNNFSILSN